MASTAPIFELSLDTAEATEIAEPIGADAAELAAPRGEEFAVGSDHVGLTVVGTAVQPRQVSVA